MMGMMGVDGGEKRIIGLETKEEFSLIRFSSSAPILPSSLKIAGKKFCMTERIMTQMHVMTQIN